MIIDKSSSELLYETSFKDMSTLFTVAKTDGKQHYLINKTLYIEGADNPTAANFGKYIKKENETWPTIAYKLYGDIDLWWLLCKVNKVTDPLAEIPNGTTIKYLLKDVVDSLLVSIKSS